MTRLREQALAFDPERPLASAVTPPASWSTWPEMFQLEQSAVFARHWLVAARAEQLAAPGSYVACHVAGEPVVIVRGQEGALRAFSNVCRHRAAEIAAGEGQCERLTCPYHGWTYSLEGQLVRAPELGAVEGFDRQRHGLAPLHAQTWGPLALVCLAQAPRDLAADLEPLSQRLAAADWQGLRFVARRRYELACNWKVFVENYLDGGYHVAHVHRGLAGQLDLAQYRTEIFDRFSIQSCGASSGGPPESAAGDFAERIGGGAIYAWIYPNFMINRYGPIMDTNLVVPLSAERCEVVFDFYFDASVADDAAFVERSLAASHTVQEEDIAVCESVQRGLRSRAFVRGPYSAIREAPQHHFHQLLAADYRSTLQAAAPL